MSTRSVAALLFFAISLSAAASSASAQAGGRPIGVGTREAERGPGLHVAPEERIARLEAALAKTNARLAELEAKFQQHTHRVPGWEIGMVREKINGRNLEVAFNPRRMAVQSGPPIR